MEALTAGLLELLRTTGSLLTQSYWGILVPVAACVWRVFWQLVLVTILWLIVGGVASLPLIIEGARYLCRRVRRWRWLEAVVWFLAAVVAWLYAHLWVASAVLFEAARCPESSSPVGFWGGLLAVLWVIGLAIWWGGIHRSSAPR